MDGCCNSELVVSVTRYMYVDLETGSGTKAGWESCLIPASGDWPGVSDVLPVASCLLFMV